MKNESEAPSIESNLKSLKANLKILKKKYGRTKEKIQILAISKNQSAGKLRKAYNFGQTQFGENYLQEALQKQRELGDLKIEWHFVGRIQSNKTTDIANNFSWVHSLERLKIAHRLNDQRGKKLPPLNVLIQINQPGENKNGVAPNKFLEFSQEIMKLKNLSLRGIMYFPPPSGTFEENRENYMKVVNLVRTFESFDTFSMGTSDDYEAAISAGSSMIRLGNIIFGPRPS